MSAAWAVALPDSEKLVLLALADWSDDDGKCWPSVAKLVAKCSKSERTIQTALKALESKGQITRDQRPGVGCKYAVHPRSDCTPAATAPVQGTTRTPAATAPNTSRNTNPSEAKASSGIVRPAFNQFWEAYPHKIGKLKARRAYDTARKATGEKRLPALPDLLTAVRSYAAKDDDRPWCNPATWLNQGRWLDEAPTPTGQGPPTPISPEWIAARQAEIDRKLAEANG